MALVAASDDDINEFIRVFPLSANHVNALSLKGCTVTDRGLESILDHLEVGLIFQTLSLYKIFTVITFTLCFLGSVWVRINRM